MQKANEEYAAYKESIKNELSRVEKDFIIQLDTIAKMLKEKNNVKNKI